MVIVSGAFSINWRIHLFLPVSSVDKAVWGNTLEKEQIIELIRSVNGMKDEQDEWNLIGYVIFLLGS